MDRQETKEFPVLAFDSDLASWTWQAGPPQQAPV